MFHWLPEKIISGGQTGVDRAALDVSLAHGIPCGGWVPKGRRAEDGELPHFYPLLETATRNYSDRTARNVNESDGTLILTRGNLKGGTKLTFKLAKSFSKPVWVVDFKTNDHPLEVRAWLSGMNVRVLNVAGPRESEIPGVGKRAYCFLEQLLFEES